MDVVTVRIPADLARRLGTALEVERHIVELLALEEYKLGHLTKPELRRLLGFQTRAELDAFLKTHEVFEPYALDDFERDQQDLAGLLLTEEQREDARHAAEGIIARRKGITLGGLKIKDLISEGRP